MNKNKVENSREEFGIEFGDINAAKLYELALDKENKKKKKPKEES